MRKVISITLIFCLIISLNLVNIKAEINGTCAKVYIEEINITKDMNAEVKVFANAVLTLAGFVVKYDSRYFNYINDSLKSIDNMVVLTSATDGELTFERMEFTTLELQDELFFSFLLQPFNITSSIKSVIEISPIMQDLGDKLYEEYLYNENGIAYSEKNGLCYEFTNGNIQISGVQKKPYSPNNNYVKAETDLDNKPLPKTDSKDITTMPQKEGEEKENNPSSELKFNDIPIDVFGWAIEPIKYLTSVGVIKGTSDTTFNPSGIVTRAQFVAFLVRGFGFEEGDHTRFSDIPMEHWGYADIKAAEKSKMLDYIDDTSFKPDEPLQRDEMAMLAFAAVQAAGKSLPDNMSVNVFDDSEQIRGAYVEAVTALNKAEIILGNGDGTFNPNSTTIRAAAAKVVFLILSLK